MLRFRFLKTKDTASVNARIVRRSTCNRNRKNVSYKYEKTLSVTDPLHN
jgi:hypothetical protein